MLIDCEYCWACLLASRVSASVNISCVVFQMLALMRNKSQVQGYYNSTLSWEHLNSRVYFAFRKELECLIWIYVTIARSGYQRTIKQADTFLLSLLSC